MRLRRDPLTRDLFEVPAPPAPLPASMDYRGEVAHLVGQALKDTDADRYEIAARMSRLQGHDVSKFMLDAWSSEARDTHNMPFYAAPILETACDSLLLTSWLADRRGARVLVGADSLHAELGRLERVKAEAVKKIRDLKRVMEELE